MNNLKNLYFHHENNVTENYLHFESIICAIITKNVALFYKRSQNKTIPFLEILTTHIGDFFQMTAM